MPKPQAEPQGAHELAPAPTCSSCAVFEDNPYTHFPEWDGWCCGAMAATKAAAPACDAYHAGAVKDLRTRKVIDPRPKPAAARGAALTALGSPALHE